MANKDGEHPEFEDMNFSDEELSFDEGGSDALNFSEVDSSGSDLFDFSASSTSGIGSELGSLDLDTADDGPAEAETLDFDEPSLEAAEESPVEEAPAKGKKKGKAKKEKKPKAKKEKPVREKKVREPKVREKKVREKKQRSSSDKPSLVAAVKSSPYSVMLFLSLGLITIAVFLLFLQFAGYGFEVSP